MIKKRPLLVAALVFCLAATIFIVSSTGYDPWIDYDEDGTVDYDDFILLAGEYGTSGNPTKDVNVTNWPQPLTAKASVCAVLEVYVTETCTPGRDFAWENVSGIGGKSVRFISGSVSGGGIQQLGASVFFERPTATGYVEVKDPLGTLVARISLPFNIPIEIDNVDSIHVQVAVPYGPIYTVVGRSTNAVAGVAYEVLS